jgi:Protein of unknown function (DUF3095)
MAVTNNDLFYNRLPVNELPLSDLLSEQHLFFTVPQSWHVLITDVKNSTQATQDGLHQTVNLVATGCIVAALNTAYKKNITVPFFFGGDGATFIIPASLLESTLQALYQHQKNVLETFKMELRVGHVAVAELYTENHELKISKLKASQKLNIPVVLGDGLSFAEKKIKADAQSVAIIERNDEYELDMSGMQCRWDKIKPPATDFEIISLLVLSKDSSLQPAAFSQVMNIIDNIFGQHEQRKPISIDKLRIVATFQKIGAEMRNRFGKFNLLYLVKTWATTLLGKLYFKTKKGKEYLYKLVDLTDTLVIDGKINTVITGTVAQREKLVLALDQLEQSGLILYGLHISNASIMSCYVRNMDEDHIHFIDGADGGYTKAAGVLKEKIARLNPAY